MKLALRIGALVVLVAGVVVMKERVRAGRSASPSTVQAAGAPTADVRPEAGGPEAATAGTAGEPLPGSKFASALKSGKPTMAEFGLGTCQACKKMVPVLAKATARYRGRANIVFVDLDAYPAIAMKYKIAVMPTQIFFNAKGKEVGRHMGYFPIEEVAAGLATAGAK